MGNQLRWARVRGTRTMKRAFVITSGGTLISALVPMNTPDALTLGHRITVTRPLDLGLGAQIETGETGTVDHIDASTGLVEILMDMWHRGLQRWDNHMWLEPYGTDDILDGIQVYIEPLEMSLAAC
jgi:hypothetical protein